MLLPERLFHPSSRLTGRTCAWQSPALAMPGGVSRYPMLDRAVLIAGLLVLCLASPQASAEIYRWVDNNGRVHFSDSPPVDQRQPVETRHYQASPAIPDPEMVRYRQHLEEQAGQWEQQRQQEQQARAEARERQQLRQQRCKDVRARRHMLDGVSSIYSTNEDGDREYWTEDERRAAELELQQLQRQYCDD